MLIRSKILIGLFFLGNLGLAIQASAQTEPAPTLNSEYLISPIAVGGTTTIKYTITNPTSTLMTGMAFTDNLPPEDGFGVGILEIADNGGATTCSRATLTAVSGGTTISLSDGELGAGQSCTVTVNVTPTTAGTYTNVSSPLTSNLPDSQPASSTLIVNESRPAFSKSFGPDTITAGGTSRLTFTIDNSANIQNITSVSFDDILPNGVTIATPANVANTCSADLADVTANPGDNIVEASFSTIGANSQCTVTVDVTSNSPDTYLNKSGDLIFSNSENTIQYSAGFATAQLTVTGADPETLQIVKEFTNDPALRGGTVDLEFRISNINRNFTATDVAFSDDLAAMTPSTPPLTFASLLSNDCGGSVTGTGTTTIALSGGTIPVGGFCTVQTRLDIPPDAATGQFTNTTTPVVAKFNTIDATGNAAANDLTIQPVAPPVFSKSFTDDPVDPGNNVTLVYTIENPNFVSAGNFTSIKFSDTLFSMASGARLVSATNTCSATISEAVVFAPYFYRIDVSGGTVAAGNSCTITAVISIPSTAPSPSQADSETGEMSALAGASTVFGGKALDTLVIGAEAPAPNPISLAKNFAADGVTEGGSVDVTFTVSSNGDNSVTEISFADDLEAFYSGTTLGSVVTNGCNGTVSGFGTSNFSYANGTITGIENCDIRVSLDMGSNGAATPTNTAGPLTANVNGAGATVYQASEASDSISVYSSDAVPVTVAKEFLDNPVIPGSTATLQFVITNPNTSNAATDIAFTDNLGDAGGMLNGSTGGSATGNTCSATVTPGSVVSVSIATLAPGAACTVDIPVNVPLSAGQGSYPNWTSPPSAVINTNTVTGTAARDDLVVRTDPISFTKAFADDLVLEGTQAVLTFTIENEFPNPATSLSFGDDLGAMLSGATYLSTNSNTCSVSPSLSGDSIYKSGTFDLSAYGICEISINVAIPADAGINSYLNTTSDLGARFGSFWIPAGTRASATLNTTTADAPSFSKSFEPSTMAQGGATTLEFSISNKADTQLYNISFTDDLNAMLAGATASGLPATPCGPTSSLTGTDTLTLGNAELAPAGSPGDSCTFSVTVNIPATAMLGTTTNRTSALTDGVRTLAGAATAKLTVTAPVAPTFSTVFSPSTIDVGETSVLTYTIDNRANLIAAESMSFTDTFPSGMSLPNNPTLTNTCGGTFVATSGNQVSLTGGTVPAGEICTVSTTVWAMTYGELFNDSGVLTSNLPQSENATATLTVDPLPLSLAMNFTPATITTTQTSTVTFTMRNTAAMDAFFVSLSDTLPNDVVIAPIPAVSTDCSSGQVSAPAGGSTISFDNGFIPSGGSCSISVDVTSSVIGIYPDTTETQTSNLGDSTPASATLTVEAFNSGEVTFEVESDTDGAYGFASAEPDFNFAIEVNGGTGSQGPISAAAGTYSISVTPPTGVALTAIDCDDTDSSGDPASRMLTVNLAVSESITCRLTAQSSLQKTVDTINRFLTKRADMILSSEPNSNRRIDRLNRGFGNSSPLTFATGDLKALLPFSAQVGRSDGSFAFSTSLLQARRTAASLELAHGATKNAVYVDNYRFDAWFEAQYKNFDAGDEGEGHFGIAYLGADYLLTPNVLIGALVQFDDMKDASATLNATASGSGWMVGPYITARLSPNLYFDARIAAGESTNKVSPFNTYTDTFDTQRWLAVASLSGEFQKGPWSIRPNASLSYFEETQSSYVDSVGATIPSQTVQLGQMQIGPSFNGRFEGDDGWLYAPYFSIDAIYNIGDTTGVTVTNASTPATEGWRARLKAGIKMTTDEGVSIGMGATYDGIGRDDFESFGLTFDVLVPLKKARSR